MVNSHTSNQKVLSTMPSVASSSAEVDPKSTEETFSPMTILSKKMLLYNSFSFIIKIIAMRNAIISFVEKYF